MNNATWACFDCREAVRRPEYALTEIPCPSCSQAMTYLGDRIRIPAKRQAKAWRELWESTRAIRQGQVRLREWTLQRVREQISQLEAMRPSATRASKIKAYKKQLATLLG